MRCEQNASQAKAENAFVWGRDLTPLGQLVIFHEAGHLFTGDEEGVRIKHVVFAKDLIEYELQMLQLAVDQRTIDYDPKDETKRLEEIIADLKTYLRKPNVFS